MKTKLFKNNPTGQRFFTVLRYPFIVLLALALAVSGCKDDEENSADKPTLEVAPATVPTFTIDGGTDTIAVTSNTKWTAKVEAAATWCEVSPTSGDGNNPVVRVTVQANASVDGRAATVTFAAGMLTRPVSVTQAAAEPILTVTPAEIPAANTAGTYSITVTSNTAWTVSDNAEWLTLSSDAGNGSGAVTVNVPINLTFDVRPATVTFTATGTQPQTVSVTQAAGVPTLTAEPTTIPLGGTASSTATINVTSNSTWTVSSNADWLSVSPASGDGSSESSEVTVTATQANTTSGPRPATVTFTYGNAQTQTVAVTQAVAPPANAASTQTWTFGTRTWSDNIQMSGCDNPATDLIATLTEAKCAAAEYLGVKYYYYNRTYFNAHETTLCPSPWRTPLVSDFTALTETVAFNDLPTHWPLCGYIFDGVPQPDTDPRQLLMLASDPDGAYFEYNSGNQAYGVVLEAISWLKHGTPVRCVLGGE